MMNSHPGHPAVDACIEQEQTDIRTLVDLSEAAILQLQTIVGRDTARFVAQDCLSRVAKFPDSMSSSTRYQILLARLYAWVKTTT